MTGSKRDPSGGWRHVQMVLVAATAFVLACSSGRAETTPTEAGCKPTDFKIALDVGHTPDASGATSARGVTEYWYNLKLARQIETTLRRSGFSRTVLITVRGTGRSQLLQRTERANALGVDLLLSIHHDDVQEAYHQKWIYNGTTHLFSDRFSGYSLFVSRENPHFERSLDFAKLLGTELMEHGMNYSAHHAEAIPGEGRELVDRKVGVYLYDQLVVLKLTRAPAVLLEAGIIVNRVEELVIASPEGRGLVGAAVLKAVTKFCGTVRQLP